MDENPSIYVACLSAYNNGELHGCWIDATLDVEDIQAKIQTVLAQSPIEEAEEFIILDTNHFEGLELSEYESIDKVHEYAVFVDEHGELGVEVLNYYGDIDGARSALSDYYHGEWDSELAYATELFDECYLHEVSESIRFYIDYDAFCRDLFINDYFSIDMGRMVHVFSCH